MATDIDTCSECGIKNGWHLSGCSNGTLSPKEIEQARQQLKHAMQKMDEIFAKLHPR